MDDIENELNNSIVTRVYVAAIKFLPSRRLVRIRGYMHRQIKSVIYEVSR
jgi:hypothetical protein